MVIRAKRHRIVSPSRLTRAQPFELRMALADFGDLLRPHNMP